MELPKRWNQIKVDQFIELKSLKEEDFGSLFLFNLEIIAIVTDTDSEELEDMPPEELINLSEQLTWMRREPAKSVNRKVLDLHFKPFDIITLGEFIDLEYYFANDFVNNLTNISALCYRLKKVDEWGNEYFEPYKYNPKDRAHKFTELPITDLYGLIPEYISFRTDIMKAYENLFMPTIEEDEEMDEEDLKEEAEEKAKSKWSWESIIYSLCGEDITKVDQVTDLPLIMVLNFLSMKTELKS